ncbi:PH domain-containing protein [Halobacillus yeomjeoni]|uniref:PH domain-containing protein n=1 Tax=Halobacillus yeomjeoni TaxID=311194 RepID=UPI001CD473A5|nr:PH domain-containing protein [Halobacillus yeomjeoni]MCA0982924.1 PH domain-containing protein [Halobacillus yeomjeoni]
MVFEAARDSHFRTLMTKAVTNMTLMLVFPFFFNQATHNIWFILVWSSIYLFLLVSFIVSVTKIRYELNENYLLVKGGPIRSKIPYDKIISYNTTADIYCGYRVLTASDAIEIFYEGGVRRSVKIAPKDQETFLEILRAQCPKAQMTL